MILKKNLDIFVSQKYNIVQKQCNIEKREYKIRN